MPPVATNLFIASAVFKKPFGQVTKAVIQTLTLTCMALVLIIFMPTISLFALSVRDGKPLISSFPWNGKPEASTGQEAPATKMPSLKSLTGKMLEGMEDEPKSQE